MTEPSNAVLAEQIKRLREEFTNHRAETRKELRELDKEVETNRRTTNEMNISMTYVKDAVKEMKDLLSGFVDVQNQQSNKIDAFINSDSRRASKNNLVVSVLQVAGGILIAIIGFWVNAQI